MKNTAKGVNKIEKGKLNHHTYKRVHEGIIKNVKSVCSNIQSVKNQLYTLKVVKNSLVKLDRKRYWIDSEKSVGYSHPSISS